MENQADDILTGRAIQGDQAAFGELMARHAQAAAALIRREIPDRHHRDDILQEINGATFVHWYDCLTDVSVALR
ncbi:MAG TPA: hypothetical protein VFJ30_01615 [Phycisphaerae bacterium]|nr:hypothetical protein [Phycisphaerae bacterium]